jgi:GT2 family glycosyltransferase
VALDLSVPFTAARARNVGYAQLLEKHPELPYVQFVDGDCELVANWCDRAVAVVQDQPTVAVVCGRLRERFPQASVFNQLCDLEWDTPVGEVQTCGGIALMRVSALQAVGGFNPTLIAGEEPELCVRLRQQAWRIVRIDAEMGWHDARMTQFSQWWRRAVRGGHAYAEVSWMYRHDPQPLWRSESHRIWFWGLGVPTLSLAGLPLTHGASLLLWLAYPLLMLKIYRYMGTHHGSRPALYYALFCTLGKFPELLGQLWFHAHRLRGDRSTLIEYKKS